jgi:hypothetical protein
MAIPGRLNGVLRLAALCCCLPAAAAAEASIKSSTGKAAKAQPSETTLCELAAWVAKDAPADLALRAGPGPGYRAVATVPGPYTDGKETYFPEVRITGSHEGWFRIAEIVTDLYGGLPTDPIITFSGEGWLPGNVLGLRVESGRLWSRPSDEAPIAFTFDEAGRQPDDDGFRLDTLHGCEGLWVEVEGSYYDKRPRGWTKDVCASQVTTCP